MERRYWWIASAIVAAAIAFLIWDPGSPTELERPSPERATIIEVPEPVEPDIATVRIEPGAARDGGPGADSSLIARFESERRDPTWAMRTEARLTGIIEGAGAEMRNVECRRTVCRLSLGFESESARADGVATVLDALRESRIVALLESAVADRAVLVVAP